MVHVRPSHFRGLFDSRLLAARWGSEAAGPRTADAPSRRRIGSPALGRPRAALAAQPGSPSAVFRRGPHASPLTPRGPDAPATAAQRVSRLRHSPRSGHVASPRAERQRRPAPPPYAPPAPPRPLPISSFLARIKSRYHFLDVHPGLRGHRQQPGLRHTATRGASRSESGASPSPPPPSYVATLSASQAPPE